MAQFSIAALKAELTTDPTGLGYAGLPDNQCTVALNLLRATIAIRRADISSGEVIEAIDTRDFTSTNSASENSWFESLTQQARIRLSLDDGSDTVVLGNLKRLLQNPGPQGSRARVIALANRQGSRAEQLWGAGTIITDADIGNARLS